MNNISAELKVGASVLMAAAILLLGILWVKDYRLGISRYDCNVHFSNVGTLEPGDPVTVMGVKKGLVNHIRIDGDRVLVTFSLDKDVAMHSDAKITLMSSGLMGERFINIEPGTSSDLLDSSDPIEGEYSAGIPEIMSE